MQAIGILRNGLIFAGITVGGALAIVGAMQGGEETEALGEEVVADAARWAVKRLSA